MRVLVLLGAVLVAAGLGGCTTLDTYGSSVVHVRPAPVRVYAPPPVVYVQPRVHEVYVKPPRYSPPRTYVRHDERGTRIYHRSPSIGPAPQWKRQLLERPNVDIRIPHGHYQHRYHRHR